MCSFKKRKNYYLNEFDEIVASYDDNSISMYFDFPESSREIWNHNGRVVATFAKDFQVNSLVADVIMLEGLLGATNDTKIVGNYAYESCVSRELDDFYDSDDKQKEFEELPYNKKIEILEKLTGATFKDTIIDGIRLFPSTREAKYASCGEIISHDGIAKIKLSDDLIIDGVKVTNIMYRRNGFDVNVLNIKGKNEDFDYRKGYDFWRKNNDWYYTTGRSTEGSHETIAWTERRKNSTVDNDAINYIGNPYSYLTDSIYYDSKSSLNSRRLQMQYVLSQLGPLGPMDLIDKTMENYGFNKRKIDVKKRTKRR